ncbi:MAG: sulfite exporter TauE/SafE family protein [Ignavibacteriales bacterium]|nr:sulfite exporter TauE/SafE family protein [Ignavibacteriales bacterium]
MNEIILFSVGVFVGMFGTIIGVGGGFIVVPLLTIFYQFSPQYAVGTSMVIVALNAISGTVSYVRQHRIDYRTGILFASATLPGSFMGAYLLQLISKPVFDISFGIFLIVIVLYLGFRRQLPSEPVTMSTYQTPHFSKPLGFVISFFVGFVASMAGIGGGVVHVPAMIYLFHFVPFIAIPTSHFILAISATFAAASHAYIGEVAWTFIPYLGAGAIIGAQIGGQLSHKIKSYWIICGLLFVMALVAIRLIVRNF